MVNNFKKFDPDVEFLRSIGVNNIFDEARQCTDSVGVAGFEATRGIIESREREMQRIMKIELGLGGDLTSETEQLNLAVAGIQPIPRKQPSPSRILTPLRRKKIRRFTKPKSKVKGVPIISDL